LLQQKSRGIQFDTFRNSQISNFYVGNGKAPLSNSFIRFALRARNDTLWTPAKKAALFGIEKHTPYCSCSNGRVRNLLHVLNNCNYHMTQMTERHNMVQDWIKEAVKKNRKLKEEDFRNNQTVVFDKFEKLKSFDVKQFGALEPNSQYWVKLGDEDKKKEIWKPFMVELAITFGKRDTDEYHNSLDNMRMHKTDKYSSMVNYVKNEMAKRSDYRTEFRVEFRTFMISSLGAIPNETVKSFKSMIGKCSMSNACLWLNRGVCKALKGSFPIWT
jgi:uncharacterized protein YdcH (DUF465 family)